MLDEVAHLLITTLSSVIMCCWMFPRPVKKLLQDLLTVNSVSHKDETPSAFPCNTLGDWIVTLAKCNCLNPLGDLFSRTLLSLSGYQLSAN
jgi:hypothetical protein